MLQENAIVALMTRVAHPIIAEELTAGKTMFGSRPKARMRLLSSASQGFDLGSTAFWLATVDRPAFCHA
jgi:hypothetical protein